MAFPVRSDFRGWKKPRILHLLAGACLVFCWSNPLITFAQPITGEQEDGAGTRPVAVAKAEVAGEAVSLDFLDTGEEPTSLAQLRAMQKINRDVAEQVFRATVNIQMGNSQGTGVIVSDDGYILTAAHVIGKPKNKATVVLFDGTELKATALGVNGRLDSGMLKIDLAEDDDRTFPWLDMAESSTLPSGKWVMAVGHPGGLDPRRGMVVRVGRLLAGNAQLMRTDCTLVGGDSGGPLVDMHAGLIGIHSRIGSNLWENIHVPIDVFSAEWDQLVAGKVISDSKSPYLGFSVVEETNEVESVVNNGPAAKAGIEKGDRIIRIDATEINDKSDIGRATRRVKIDQTIKLTIQRGEKELVLDLKVEGK